MSSVNMDMALKTVERWIDGRECHYVCVTGVHGVMESQRSEELRRIHNRAGLVTPDGMPMVWLSRLLGHSHVSRVYGPDMLLALCERAVEKLYRLFLYGGAEGVPELLKEKLCQRFPGLQVVGSYSPPFRSLTSEEELELVDRINSVRPDIVFVGLGTPKQERWMARFVESLDVPVLIGVGAAFDLHAGLKKQAPRWMQRSGLEWFFRLLSEPRRLWKRYLINNPLFVILILLQLVAQRKKHLAG